MLTIFTSARPFLGKFDYIQRNAIQSWRSVCPGCEIILIGEEEGADKAAAELGIQYIPDVTRNEEGVILRNSVFQEAQRAARNELLCFVNADIIFTSTFLRAIQSVRISPFLLSGRRWDLELSHAIDFRDTKWEETLLSRARQEGKLHGPSAGDYFVFPRSVGIEMPPFSIRHGGWDNWIIWRFKSLGIPVIDATEAIDVVHQIHKSPSGKRTQSAWKSKQGKEELRLAGGFSSMLTLREADWVLTSRGLEKPKLGRRILGAFAKVPLWRKLLGVKRHVQHSF